MSDFKLDVPFHLSNPWEFPLHGVPLRASIPLPEGAVRVPRSALALVDEKGTDVRPQWRTLSNWKDGSVRFALMDYAETRIPPRTNRSYRLIARAVEGDAATGESRDGAAIVIRENDSFLEVDTGRLRWKFSRKRYSFAEEIHFNNREWIGGQESDLCVMDVCGQIYRASSGRYRIGLEDCGPHRVVVLVEGDYRNPLGQFMDYKVRLHFTLGGAQALMLHTVRNRHDGREGRDIRRLWLAGGLHLGDRTIRRVQQLGRTLNTVQAMVEIPENVDLDTGPYQTTIRNRGSLRENPDDICHSVQHGLDIGQHGACTPLIDLHEPGKGGMLFKFAMASPDREGPMRLASDRGRFEIDFYPEVQEAMHLGEGMGKTRDVLFNFHDDSLSAQNLVHESANLSYPGAVGVPHEVYRQARFADVHLALVQQPNKYPLLESKIDTLLAAQHAYDWPTASGWRDHGDEIGARGRCPEFGVRQFINNEEDYLYVCMLDAWRTGRPYGALSMARHLMDIDYIDYSADPARDGACCPHSTDHTNGEVYPSHQWCQGLLYFHLATGDEEALRIAKRIGDCLIWWITGPRKEALTFSGRETAWPMLSLAALYEVTHEEKYRDAGMQIIEGLLETHAQHGQLVWEYPPGSGIYSGYMAAMSFNGIYDMWTATGDPRVLELWKNITRPVVEGLSDPNHWGYIHFRNWPIKWADLTTLARWYHLTGDRKYVELGRNGLRLVLAGCPQPLNQTQGFIAMGYRHFIFFLKLADEFGMIDDNHCTLVW